MRIYFYTDPNDPWLLAEPDKSVHKFHGPDQLRLTTTSRKQPMEVIDAEHLIMIARGNKSNVLSWKSTVRFNDLRPCEEWAIKTTSIWLPEQGSLALYCGTRTSYEKVLMQNAHMDQAAMVQQIGLTLTYSFQVSGGEMESI
jgi:hypothetical protein